MRRSRLMALILASCFALSFTGCQQNNSGPINSGSHNRDTSENNNNDNDDNDDDNPGELPPLDLPAAPEGGGDDAPVTVTTTPGAKNFKAEWEGMWLSDEYDNFNGYITVEPSASGDLSLTFVSGDKTVVVTGKEINYDSATYDYGSFETAQLENDKNWTITYSKEPDSTYISFDGSNPFSTDGEYLWTTFYKFTGGFHTAPDNFNDTDSYGKLSRKDSSDSDYFFADTDDFILEYRKSDSMWNGNESIDCESYLLTSYDENSNCIGWRKTKYVFEDETDAVACFNYQNANYGGDYYKYYRDGNLVYQWYKGSGYCKMNQVYGWYVDCHYCVMSSNEDYLYYAYFSKPISSADYRLSLEDVLYYRSVRGSHYCLDTKDASLEVYIGKDSTSLYAYCDGDDYYRGSGYNVVKVDGMTIYSISNDLYYKWISGDNYQQAVIFQVYEFGAEEATVTEYQFLVDDVENSGITLDNFMSKTPDKVISHRFDMTRIKMN